MLIKWLRRLLTRLHRLKRKRTFLVGVLPDTPADEGQPEEFIWEIEAYTADEAIAEAFARDEGLWDDLRIARAYGHRTTEDERGYLELAKCFCRIVGVK